MPKVAVQLRPRQRCPLCHDPLAAAPVHELTACQSCQTVYHGPCARELGGCSTLGCARAGASARPQGTADQERGAKQDALVAKGDASPPPRPDYPLRRGRLTACVLASWLLFPFFYLSWPFIVGLSLTAAAEGTRARRPWRGGLLAFALSSLFVVPAGSFLSGIGGYLGGDGRLWGYGLMSGQRLHPELRTYTSSSGCLLYGYEVLTQTPHNLALSGLIRACGPMSQSYQGPYPTPEEALELVQDAPRVSFRELEDGQLGALDLEPTPQLIEVLARHMPEDEARVRLLEDEGGRCLLVSPVFPAPAPGVDPPWSQRPQVHLIDLERGERFASYD